jgi:hypothetical protein
MSNEGIKKDRPQNKNLRPAKKGEIRNPKGRPPLSPIQKALRELTVETYRTVIELVVSGNMAELQRMIDDPKISVLQIGVAKAFMKAMKAGDYQTIERIAERIVGKIPDQINLVSKNLNADVTLNAESSVTKDEVKAAFDELEREV